MKKLLMSTTIGAVLAATLSPSAHALSVPVSSTITGMQLWLADANLMTHEAPGYFTGLQFGGTAEDYDNDGYIDDADLTFVGEIGFTTNGINVRLNFNLADGGFVPNSGVTFRGGDVLIEVQTTDGWVTYGVVDASTTNLGFLANQPGHMASWHPGQTTAGIVRDELPGLWDGQVGSAGFDRAAGSLTLLGQTVGLYLEGDLTTGFPNEGGAGPIRFGPPEVPVPAAAWLFGSGLAGLAAVGRRRRV